MAAQPCRGRRDPPATAATRVGPERPGTPPPDQPLPEAIGRTFDSVRPIADAILYEGYVLYPYRKTSAKNRGPRWQFGVLSPRTAIRPDAADDVCVAGSVESWFQQTQCLVEGAPQAPIGVRVRFLHLLRRTIERVGVDGSLADLAQLEVAGRLYVAFDEALPREHDILVSAADLLGDECHFDIRVAGHESVEAIKTPAGDITAMVRRRCLPLSAQVSLQMVATSAPFPLHRLQVRIENTEHDLPVQASRDDALARSLIATHTFITMPGGRFLSMLDPPQWAAQAAQQCANVHTFPVLGGESDDLVISSPIIMYDHPAVAPESQGDFFDSTEIDELLSLRALTMSDAERREARATDPRSAEILNRVDDMPPELLAKLHGAVRSMRPLPRKPEAVPAPAGDDTVRVTGGTASKGSVVRLRPRRHGTDAHDMFLAGRTARLERVLLDVDGSVHVAISIDDDPAAELHGWYGRVFYFAPDELELLDPEPGRAECAP